MLVRLKIEFTSIIWFGEYKKLGSTKKIRINLYFKEYRVWPEYITAGTFQLMFKFIILSSN